MNDEKSPRHQFSLMLMTFPFIQPMNNRLIFDCDITVHQIPAYWKSICMKILWSSSYQFAGIVNSLFWKEAKLKISILAEERRVRYPWSMDPTQCTNQLTTKGNQWRQKICWHGSGRTSAHITSYIVKWNNKSIDVFSFQKWVFVSLFVQFLSNKVYLCDAWDNNNNGSLQMPWKASPSTHHQRHIYNSMSSQYQQYGNGIASISASILFNSFIS